MPFVVKFETAGSVFGDADAYLDEVKRQLTGIVTAMTNGCGSGVLRDANGDTIGSWSATRG